MKLVVGLIALLWPAVALAQFAPQQWTADQDGGDFLCYDVHSLQVNNMSGVGARCVEVDSTGTFFAVACSSIGGVSSVTGTAGRTVATPTTGAVVVDLATFGSSPSCTNASVVVDAYGRSTCTSGTAPVTSVGVTAPITTTGGTTPTIGISLPAGQAAFGTGTNVSSSPNFFWDNANAVLGIDTNTPLAGTGIHADKSINSIYTPVFMTNSNGGTLAAVGFRVGLDPTNISTKDTTITVFGTGATAYGGIYAAGNVVWNWGPNLNDVVMSQYGTHDFIWTTTTSQTERWRLQTGGNLRTLAMTAPGTPAAGYGAVYFDSTSKNIAIKNDAGTVNHGAQTKANSAGVALTALADNGSWTTQTFQAPLVACTDYISLSCVTGATDLGGTNATPTVIGVENAATLRGDVISTNIAGPPATPSAGFVTEWTDTTFTNAFAINSSGTINHMMKDFTCSASTFATSGNSGGTTTCTQPAFTDISGTASYSQLPAQPTAGQVDISAGTTSAPVGDSNFTYNTGTHILTSAGGSTLGGSVVFSGGAGSGEQLIGIQNSGAYEVVFPTTGLSLASGVLSVVNGAVFTVDLPYAFVFLGILNPGELISGGSSPNPTGSIGTTQTEYPMGVVAGHVQLRCNLIHNFISSGTYTLKASRNASDTTASLSFTSATPLGIYFSSNVAIGSPNLTDLWGVDVGRRGFCQLWQRSLPERCNVYGGPYTMSDLET